MRHAPGIGPVRPSTSASRRLVTAGAPLAIVGSLALTTTVAPAAAAERAVDTAVQTRDVVRTASHADARAAAALRVAAEAGGDQYTVQPGDTVSGIAAAHGLRTADVLALNGLSWSTIIQPGQVLRLAGAPASVPDLPAPAPATGAASSHTVVAGDTISAIASRSGASVDAVLAANGLTWSSIIVPGQEIVIPGGETSAAPTPAPAPAPAPAGSAYTIVAGDSISAIAQQHGVTVQDVLEANALTTESIIYPGQTIAVPAASAPAMLPASSEVPASPTSLDEEQTANARLIIAIGREVGVSDRAIAIALGTAMQESWLRNLDGGDRDSVGLFQQRPSMGWGSIDEAHDPARATRVFFGGAADPNGDRTRGLLDIPDWESLSFADAAQAVQISAYPERYAQWEQPAAAWLAALG